MYDIGPFYLVYLHIHILEFLLHAYLCLVCMVYGMPLEKIVSLERYHLVLLELILKYQHFQELRFLAAQIC